MTTPQATITEARKISDHLIERERGNAGGNVELAIYRASQKYGVAASVLKSLRYRWRELKSIPAHVLEKLREIDEAQYEKQRKRLLHEIELAKLTASRLDPDISEPLEAEIERLGLLYPPMDEE